MSARKAYISVKQNDLKELESKVEALGESTAQNVDKFRNACQSASVMLERVVNGDDATWKEMQPTVDGAFRNAYDCLRQIKAQ